MDCNILQGDALELLRTLPPESVHTCVTSPPYYNLRDYGVEGQIGNEGSVEEYLQALVAVFREVRRVLHPNGTLWVNVGDSYATNSGNQPPTNTRNSCGHTAKRVPQGYKKKDLIGIPWQLAFALRADGWYLRQDIIWQKPNCMPESVNDRCTRSHEYIFLLSKSAHYYFNAAAISEPVTSAKGNARTFRGGNFTPAVCAAPAVFLPDDLARFLAEPHHSTSAILLAAISTYEGLISHPIKPRPMRLATTPAVPLPANGSSTTPPSGQPAKIHGSISFSGNVAKCAPRNPFVLTLQTLRLFLRPVLFLLFPWLSRSTCALLS